MDMGFVLFIPLAEVDCSFCRTMALLRRLKPKLAKRVYNLSGFSEIKKKIHYTEILTTYNCAYAHS